MGEGRSTRSGTRATNVCAAIRPTSARARGTAPIAGSVPDRTLPPLARPTMALDRTHEQAGRRHEESDRAGRKTAATSANATSSPAASGPNRCQDSRSVHVAPFAAIRSLPFAPATAATLEVRAGRESEQTPTAAAAPKTRNRSPHRSSCRNYERRRSQQHNSQEKSLTPESIAQRRCERRDHAPGADARARRSNRRGSAMRRTQTPPTRRSAPTQPKNRRAQANSARRTSTFRPRHQTRERLRRRDIRTVNPTPKPHAGPAVPYTASCSLRHSALLRGRELAVRTRLRGSNRRSAAFTSDEPRG